MKAFNRVDWEGNLPYLFITVTYPDETMLYDRYREKTYWTKRSKKQYKKTGELKITQHRWVFWKRLEEWNHGPIPCFWRVEWKPRLSGELIGSPMPHIHFLAMGQAYIPWQEVQWHWQNAIGERFVNTDVRAVYDLPVAINYLSKYLGKTEFHSLEDDAYLDLVLPGRPWGLMRSPLIVRSEKHVFRLHETDDVASMRHFAIPQKTELIDAGMCSFTLLDTPAKEIGEMLVDIHVDQRIESM